MVSAASWSDSYVESLLKKSPRSEVLQQTYATIAANRQDWPEALRRAERFLTQNPRAPSAWILTLGALRKVERDDDARAVARKAVRRLPRSFDILLVCSRYASEHQEWDEALRLLGRMRRLEPGRHEGYTEAAAILLRTGDRDAAERVLAQARARLPDSAAVWCAGAKLAERVGAPQEAEAAWQAAMARFPTAWEVYLGKAEMLRTFGRGEEAVALLEEARSFFPNNKAIAAAADRMAQGVRG